MNTKEAHFIFASLAKFLGDVVARKKKKEERKMKLVSLFLFNENSDRAASSEQRTRSGRRLIN